MSIEKAKFRKPVEPGSVLELRVEVLRARERGGKIRGACKVHGFRISNVRFEVYFFFFFLYRAFGSLTSNPIRFLGFSDGVIRARMASNTTVNCSS